MSLVRKTWSGAGGSKGLLSSGRCLAALLLGLGGWLTGVEAADDTGLNFARTTMARKALADDPQLASLNLGVKVRDRVAILWGSVPSLELAERALKVVRELPVFRRVESELEIEPSGAGAATDQPRYLPDPSPQESRAPASPRKAEWLPVVGTISIVPVRMEQPIHFAQDRDLPTVESLPPIRPAGSAAVLTGRLIAAEHSSGSAELAHPPVTRP